MPVRRRKCIRCERSRDVKFFAPRGRVCVSCRKRRVQLASRDVRLLENYGITRAEHEEIVAYQGGVCAICKGRRSYSLDTDHDHALERAGVPARETVRGALCKTCNRRLLRAARDNVEILQAAIDYLKYPPAFDVLQGPMRGRCRHRPTGRYPHECLSCYPK